MYRINPFKYKRAALVHAKPGHGSSHFLPDGSMSLLVAQRSSSITKVLYYCSGSSGSIVYTTLS